MKAASIWTLSNAQLVIEAVATLAFALSGLIDAARKRLDAVGVCGCSRREARKLRWTCHCPQSSLS